MDVYLKVWRYRGGVFQYRSSSNPEQDLAPDKVELADWQRSRLKEDDWLIQKLPASARGTTTQTIKATEISAIFPDSRVPAKAEIWHWDGKNGLRRAYRRTGSSKKTSDAEDLAGVQALCDGADEQVILYCGTKETSFIYHPETDQWEHGDLEEIVFQMARGQQASSAVFDQDDVLLVSLIMRLSKVKTKLIQLDRGTPDDPEKSLPALAAEVAREVLEGAEPAPVQGHNVLHGVPSLCENLDKVVSVCTGRQNLCEVNEANGQKFSSSWGGDSGKFAQGMGQGVSLVDGAWQACGTLIAWVRSFIDMKDILEEDADSRKAKYGGNARSRQLLTIGSHTTKLVQTSANISDAIMKVTAAASTVPTQIVPVAGIITGLVTTVRSSVQAEKSRRRANRLRNVLNQKGGQLPDDVGDLLGYGMRKASRKHKFKAAEATTAAAGTAASTILLVGACVAGANAWNPVGWGLGALVVIAGSGLLIYKLIRRKTSASRAKKRGFTRKDYPRKVLSRFVKAFSEEPSSITTESLAALLEAYGCDPLSIIMGGDKEIELAEARIARHLK